MKNNKNVNIINMETNNLTEQEIKDLIIKFNLDESINDLKKYYATPTTWDIINQSRKETRHTQFLAWFFGNKDFNADPNAGPIKKLIVLLLKWANMQASAEYDEALANSIYSQNLSILSYNVIAEFPIFIKRPSEHTPAYEEGDIDIVIKCTAMVNDVERNINIVIENKIGSPETIKCFDKDGKRLDKPNKNNVKTVLYQTEAYYQYITEKYKDDINIFAFLKPTDCKLKDIKRAKCKCDKYIQINYQELLDNIIQPVSDQKDISVENMYRLKDYIKTLGKPAETDDDKDSDTNKNIIIMAMEQKERELLTTFFKNNEDLIRAAINALGIPELSQSMAKVAQGGHPRRAYAINGNGSYSMYDVLEKFVEYRLAKSSDSVQDIDKEIKGYIGGERVNVSDTQDIRVFQEGKKSHGTFTFNGREIRYTKQWGDGDSKSNFCKFRENVSKNYTDFQINVI